MLYLITAHNIDGSYRQWAQRMPAHYTVDQARFEAARTDRHLIHQPRISHYNVKPL